MVLLAVVLAVIGCFRSSDGGTAVVSGSVTHGGKPVGAGTVLFMTDGGQAASAELKLTAEVSKVRRLSHTTT